MPPVGGLQTRCKPAADVRRSRAASSLSKTALLPAGSVNCQPGGIARSVPVAHRNGCLLNSTPWRATLSQRPSRSVKPGSRGINVLTRSSLGSRSLRKWAERIRRPVPGSFWRRRVPAKTEVHASRRIDSAVIVSFCSGNGAVASRPSAGADRIVVARQALVCCANARAGLRKFRCPP